MPIPETCSSRVSSDGEEDDEDRLELSTLPHHPRPAVVTLITHVLLSNIQFSKVAPENRLLIT